MCGEVYDVNDIVLQKLDAQESHPDIYKREKIQINLQPQSDGDQLTECWCYFLTDFHPSMLTLPFLETYHAYGTQNFKQDRTDFADLGEFYRSINDEIKDQSKK